jgi:hypothetical protein
LVALPTVSMVPTGSMKSSLDPAAGERPGPLTTRNLARNARKVNRWRRREAIAAFGEAPSWGGPGGIRVNSGS